MSYVICVTWCVTVSSSAGCPFSCQLKAFCCFKSLVLRPGFSLCGQGRPTILSVITNSEQSRASYGNTFPEGMS